ncbi:MAG: alpha/beta fold hydrolase [Dehalococcoidia bacterium]
MDAATFHQQRRYAATPAGRIAYVERGSGPPALFLHGVPLNGFHWRHVMDQLADLRRCIALDLLGLGYTEISPAQDVSFAAQAQMTVEFLDALGIDQVDLVGNDSGGAIAQIVAARHPERVRTLTLTNCDVHDHWPPAAVLPTLESARAGLLAGRFRTVLEQPEKARDPRGLGACYADPSALTDEAIRVYLEPLVSSQERAATMHRYWTSFDVQQTVAVEPLLRRLTVPTQIVWATEDIFFDIESARWLRDTIPGVVRLIEVSDAKLFFPEDQPEALVAPLRELWTGAYATSTTPAGGSGEGVRPAP